MLYCVKGELIKLEPRMAVVMCGGVGFRLQITMNTARQMPAIGAEAMLYTEMVVREDAMELFGFADQNELTCFKQLTSISGVGPKAGISILSELTPERVALAVAGGGVFAGHGRLMERPQKPYFDLFDEKNIFWKTRINIKPNIFHFYLILHQTFIKFYADNIIICSINILPTIISRIKHNLTICFWEVMFFGKLKYILYIIHDRSHFSMYPIYKRIVRYQVFLSKPTKGLFDRSSPYSKYLVKNLIPELLPFHSLSLELCLFLNKHSKIQV